MVNLWIIGVGVILLVGMLWMGSATIYGHGISCENQAIVEANSIITAGDDWNNINKARKNIQDNQLWFTPWECNSPAQWQWIQAESNQGIITETLNSPNKDFMTANLHDADQWSYDMEMTGCMAKDVKVTKTFGTYTISADVSECLPESHEELTKMHSGSELSLMFTKRIAPPEEEEAPSLIEEIFGEEEEEEIPVPGDMTQPPDDKPSFIQRIKDFVNSIFEWVKR